MTAGNLTLSYETGDSAAVNTALPAGATRATITGLSSGSAYTLSLGWKSAGTGISWSGTREVTMSANMAPEFAAGALTRSVPENSGKGTTAANTNVGAVVVATDPEGDTPVVYSLDPASNEFKVNASSGQIQVKSATNFNHEKKDAYTLTLKATDAYTAAPESSTKEVVINVTDRNETPNNYSSHSLGTLGVTSNRITLSWNNNEYERQFDAEDRYSIVISYGTGGSGVGTLTLAADATEATLTGLEPGTTYAITLQWLSQDNLGSTAVVSFATGAAGVEIGRAGLRALTPSSKTSAISLRLEASPAAANVTLTITSGNPHVEVDKQTMVFSTSTWNVWQALTFELTEAGAGVVGVRSATVSIAVHDQGNSDANYRSVAGQAVVVDIDVEHPGKTFYDARCSGCHGNDGNSGFASDFNPIPGTSVISGNPAKAIEVVLQGRTGGMPSFASSTDAEIAGVLSYIYEVWNEGEPVTEAQVASVRKFGADFGASRPEDIGEAQTPAGQAIATVQVSSASALTAPIVYSIVSAGSDTGFVIDSSTGVISPSSPINFDYESGKDKYTLNIRATDAGNKNLDGEFLLSITDVNEPPQFIAISNRMAYLHGGRIVTLFQPAEDPEGGHITYNIRNRPTWLAHVSVNDVSEGGFPFTTSDDELNLVLWLNTHPVGQYTITVTAQDESGNQATDATFQFHITDPEHVANWTVADGEIAFVYSTPLCGLKDAFSSFEMFVGEFNFNGSLISDADGSGKYGRVYLAESRCGSVLNRSGNLYGNAATSYKVDLTAADNVKISFATPPRTFNFRVHDRIIYGFNPERSGFVQDFSDLGRVVNLAYQVSTVSVTVPEAVLDSGAKLATVTIASGVPNAQWSVVATAEKDVAVSPVSGSQETKAVVALAAAATLDYEADAQHLFARLTILTQEDDLSAGSQKAAETRMVLMIGDINEPPFFADGVLVDQEVSGSGGGSFSLAATDPEGDALVYSATLAGESGLPDGVSIASSDATFTVAPGTAIADHVIEVRAEESGNSANFVVGRFTLNIVQGGGISADVSSLQALTPSSSTDTIPVQLLLTPAAGNIVTVTIASGTPEDLTVAPATMLFDSDNWNSAQDLTVSIAADAAKGSRNVEVNIMVHDVGNSDPEYQNAPAVAVPVAVNIPNASPVFAASQREKEHEENVGTVETAVGTDVGTAVVATDEDNDDAADLTYSINPASSRFGIDAGTGQLTVKTATNFNHEVRGFYTVTVEVQDDEAAAIRGKATVTVAIGITDADEKPGNYSNHSLVTMGMTGSQITLSWNNTDYETQFVAEDRYSLVISYGTGGSGVGTLTLAADATAATLAGLNSGTSYAITLQWLSRDQVGSDNPATISGATTAPGVEIDRAGLSALTPTSKTSAISLRLKVPPASANVTLTITSVNPEHVEVDPQTMVFSTSNWSAWQVLMFSLTDAGAGIEGMRSVAVSITVHDQSNSDATYRGVAGQEVAVKVDVPYAGQAIYRRAYPQSNPPSCSNSSCHGQNGEGNVDAGRPALFPLSNNIKNDKEKAIRVVLGLERGLMRGNAYAGKLSNAEIADVLIYIYNSWGNSGGPVTEAQVKQVRDMTAFLGRYACYGAGGGGCCARGCRGYCPGCTSTSKIRQGKSWQGPIRPSALSPERTGPALR